ncbi:MOSC domain-containing protein [Sphingosinicella soli]|uniref:Ferredoxin-NADP reductase/MOSC domain-containing protein YiiM n=1 Tax=Sphingosinicella soli TaxID=333708 RepID=A0A7W7B5X7_9SPHN|nr:MOSC domain-containing protein [Sphingosinicella soli]MBB4633753.1 ferredoxin-NADP reductase/MOSC domain-containing protein YiiM [Sphingosinicella soli]
MKLLDICIGKTRTLTINGHEVKTAYLKEAVPGPWKITEGGLEGNEVAVHTDAVYAFAREGYDFWAERLGVDPAEWQPGVFGENLTVSGLNEQDLRLGDEVEIGDVRLIVAGPRIPCFKLTWRLGQPETFIREFALSGRTGVYFGVLNGGSVSRGDSLRVVLSDRSQPTVSDVARYVFGDDSVSEDALRHVLSLPYLSQTAALILRSKLYRILDLEQTRKDRWQNWREMRVAEIVEETPEIKSFRLEPADGGNLAPFRAGQFLTVGVDSADGHELVRTWSLSDYHKSPGSYRLTIKREALGKASPLLHDTAKVGDALRVRAPAGRFVLDRSGFKPVVMIAAGIGVTPFLAMLKSHLERGDDAPPLYFVHCARNRESQAFRAQIDALLAENKNAKLLFVYSAPGVSDVAGEDYHLAGRFKPQFLYDLMADSHIIHGGKRIDLPWFESDIYICGPAAFESELRAVFIEQGANPDRVFSESFSAPSGGGTGSSVDTAEVVFSRSGITTRWDADSGLSLLELAEEHGLLPASGCRMGICQACTCTITEGALHYDPAPSAPAPDGSGLLCIGRPKTARIVIDV